MQNSGCQKPDAALQLACIGGLARCTIRLGEIRGGKQLALQAGTSDLLQECGAILEGASQLTDAAEMFEQAGQV